MRDKLKYIEIIIAVVCCIAAMVIGIIIGNKEESNNYKYKEDAIFVNTEITDDSEEEQNIIVVEIKGEVKKPDVYTVREGSILKDLIELAGGLTEEGDTSNINRARKLINNECIVVGKKGEIVEATGSESLKGASSGLVNINTATIAELDALPDIGPSRAEAIVKYREKSGGFKAIDEVKNISGIGEKSFEKLKELICV